METLQAHVAICSIKKKLKHECNFWKLFCNSTSHKSLNYQVCNESLTKLCRFRFQQKVRQGSSNLPNSHKIQFSANVVKWLITIYLVPDLRSWCKVVCQQIKIIYIGPKMNQINSSLSTKKVKKCHTTRKINAGKAFKNIRVVKIFWSGLFSIYWRQCGP